MDCSSFHCHNSTTWTHKNVLSKGVQFELYFNSTHSIPYLSTIAVLILERFCWDIYRSTRLDRKSWTTIIIIAIDQKGLNLQQRKLRASSKKNPMMDQVNMFVLFVIMHTILMDLDSEISKPILNRNIPIHIINVSMLLKMVKIQTLKLLGHTNLVFRWL